MEKLVFLLAIASLSLAQQQQYTRDPKEAAIISEKRYLSGNGQFGSAYTQEDGVQFTEESDAEGNRKGAYSYVDPNGQRRTVTYTAGKNGFQASGDHLPVAPAAPAAPAPVAPAQQQWSAPAAPAERQWSAPAPQQWSAPAPQQWSAPAAPAPSSSARQYSVEEANAEGQYHAIYDDVDYWQRQKQSGSPSWSAPTAAPAAPAPQQWSAPAAAAPRQWSAPAAPAPQWSAPAAPAQPLWNAAPTQTPQQWSQQAAAAAAPAPAPQSWEYNTIASNTEAPHRFFPPGKLDLNRSPDGFTYSFSKS